MLFNYLRDWRTWVNRGAPDCEPYSRGDGLCLSTDSYVFRYVRSECRQDTYVDLRAKLENALENDFGDNYRYPFGGEEKYKEEYQHETMHLNEARLAWVDKYLLETRKDYDLALLDFLKKWKADSASHHPAGHSRGLCNLLCSTGQHHCVTPCKSFWPLTTAKLRTHSVCPTKNRRVATTRTQNDAIG